MLFIHSKEPVKLIKRVKIANLYFTVCVRSVPRYHFNPILDGGGGQICPPPPAGFLNIAQKPLGLGS